ncbi:hypothetical protein C8J57DRAFT_986482, partial [Mycena rebaudengoi]
DPDMGHRGREIIHKNLLKRLACTGKSSKPMWSLFREWTDNKPVKPRVTLEQLRDSFKARTNPLDGTQESFDADLHQLVSALCDSIPKRTTDQTPQRFSCPITM